MLNGSITQCLVSDRIIVDLQHDVHADIVLWRYLKTNLMPIFLAGF